MNHEADGIAKWYLHKCEENPEISISQHLGGVHWSIWCGDTKLVGEFDKKIVEHIHGSRLITHIANKKGWTESKIQSVDWEAIRLTSSSNSCGDTLSKMKVASGFAPVAKWMVITKQWESDACPRCGSHVENLEHLVACGHVGAQAIRRTNILDFKQSLIDKDTSPFII